MHTDCTGRMTVEYALGMMGQAFTRCGLKMRKEKGQATRENRKGYVTVCVLSPLWQLPRFTCFLVPLARTLR